MAAEFKRLNDLGYSMESIGKMHQLSHASVSVAIKRLKLAHMLRSVTYY